MKISFIIGILVLTSALARALYADPQSDYMLRCQGCHLPDGSGFIGKVPSLVSIGDFLTVQGGREFLIQVPGTAQSVLTDSQTADVLNWILWNLAKDSLPADFEPYTAAEVSRFRQQRLSDVSKIRAELIARLQSVN
jgi:hypothetical protein